MPTITRALAGRWRMGALGRITARERRRESVGFSLQKPLLLPSLSRPPAPPGAPSTEPLAGPDRPLRSRSAEVRTFAARMQAARPFAGGRACEGQTAPNRARALVVVVHRHPPHPARPPDPNQNKKQAALLQAVRNYAVKDVRFGIECREAVLSGVNKLADAVQVTLGPKVRGRRGRAEQEDDDKRGARTFRRCFRFGRSHAQEPTPYQPQIQTQTTTKQHNRAATS